jgi:hypothetical protein
MPQPSVGPVAAKKRPRSSERLKSMLAPTMRSPAGADPFGGEPPVSLDEYAMRDYRYNPANYAPEELEQYASMLAQDQRSPWPARTDVRGGYAGNRRPEIVARQDSIYDAARIGEAQTLQRRKVINDLMRGLGGIFGPQNVRLER